MAGSELMSGVRKIIHAEEACLTSPQAETDFVLVVLCGLIEKTRERLDRTISQKLIYRQALRQSGVHWPGLDGAGR
jgi:hypothetical protein